MEAWLCFMADVAHAQHIVATTLEPIASPSKADVLVAVAARIPPIAADGHRRAPVWRAGLARLLENMDAKRLPRAAAAVISDLRSRDAESMEALADAFLRGGLDQADAGAGFWIAAALQVCFTRVAANLHADSLRLLEHRGLCPCCGSTPVSGLVTASGQAPGARFLYCSLCSSAWNHTRAVCVTCGGARTLSLRGIEGDSGVAMAETCDECRTYTKLLYEAKDSKVDPFADDLATLGLDVMIGEAGWARHAPNPLLLVA
jgi:FdhE protein